MSERNEVNLYEVSVSSEGIPQVDLFYSPDHQLGSILCSDPSFLNQFLGMLKKGEAVWDDDKKAVSFGMKVTA